MQCFALKKGDAVAAHRPSVASGTGVAVVMEVTAMSLVVPLDNVVEMVLCRLSFVELLARAVCVLAVEA